MSRGDDFAQVAKTSAFKVYFFVVSIVLMMMVFKYVLPLSKSLKYMEENKKKKKMELLKFKQV